MSNSLSNAPNSSNHQEESRNALAQWVLESLTANIAVLNHQGFIIEVNKAWRDFGRQNGLATPSAAIGVNYLDVCRAAAETDPDIAVTTAGLQSVLKQQVTSFYHEYPCHSPTEQRWFALCVTSFELLGQRYIVVSHENITLRRLAEDKVRAQHHELVHLARMCATGQIASSLTHELNQPLGAVANFSAGLITRLQHNPPSSGQILSVLQEIQNETARAGEIVRSLRRFVQKRPARTISADLRVLADEAIRLQEYFLQQHSIKLIRSYPQEIPHVSVDPIQIQQVIINLLLNSIDAFRDHPQPSQVISLTIEAADACVLLTFSDNGPGVPPETIPKLLDPFFTTHHDCLGLGLTICREIIIAHGGHIALSLPPSGGLTVSITLPWAAPSEME